MEFAERVRAFAGAAAAGDGAAVAAHFTPDGEYHDVFYGTFRGREAIASLICDHFHRDGENFLWDMHEPVSAGDRGYARYVFSYDARLPGSEGTRALFEGVGLFELRDGLFRRYREVAEVGTALALMRFAPERILRRFRREAEQLAVRDEARHHRVRPGWAAR